MTRASCSVAITCCSHVPLALPPPDATAAPLPLPQQAFALTVLLPLAVLYKLEVEARSAFLVRLPLLPPELPPQPLVTTAG